MSCDLAVSLSPLFLTRSPKIPRKIPLHFLSPRTPTPNLLLSPQTSLPLASHIPNLNPENKKKKNYRERDINVSCEMKNKTTHHFYFNLLSLLLLLLLLPIFIFSFFLSSANADSFNNGGLTDTESLYIKQRQLLYYRDEFGDRGENVTIDSSLVFENPRLRNAYIALQAWKEAILSDPQNLTGNWVGSDVCHYTGVYCAQALDNHSIKTVAGIDLNHGDIAGYLPEELGLLTDLALFHINSNRFCGTVPHKFKNLKLLYELDLSNNRFAGKFPLVVLKLPVL